MNRERTGKSAMLRWAKWSRLRACVYAAILSVAGLLVMIAISEDVFAESARRPVESAGNVVGMDVPPLVEKTSDKISKGSHASIHAAKKIWSSGEHGTAKMKRVGVKVRRYAGRHIHRHRAVVNADATLAGSSSISVANMTAGTKAVETAQPVVAAKPPRRFDLGISYFGGYSLRAETDQRFWLKGGSVALGANLWKGWGVAADLTSGRAGSIGKSGIPLSIVAVTVGSRYRWHRDAKLSVYGQFLFGGVRGFGSSFPKAPAPQPSAHSFATQLGGGVDLRVTPRVAVRVIEAGWLRTQLPNSTNDVQNTLRLGAGVSIRF